MFHFYLLHLKGFFFQCLLQLKYHRFAYLTFLSMCHSILMLYFLDKKKQL
jgi:hypothetical protein